MSGFPYRRERPRVGLEPRGSRPPRTYRLILENGVRESGCYRVLEAAWPTIAAALPRFLAGPNDRLQNVCEALGVFLEDTQRWDEWLALAQAAEVRAVEVGDFLSAGWRAYDAGWVHYLRDQPAEVLAWADRAEAHWQVAGAEPVDQINARRLRGRGHEVAKDWPAALAVFREVVEYFRAAGSADQASSQDLTELAISLDDLAGIEWGAGDRAAAELSYDEALEIALAVNYAPGMAESGANLAALVVDRGDWRAGESLARLALALAEELEREDLIGWDCCVLAQALVRQGKAAEALPQARRAVKIFTRLQSGKLKDAMETLAECGG